MRKPKDPYKVITKVLGRDFFNKLKAEQIMVALGEAGCFSEAVMQEYFTAPNKQEQAS